MITVAPNIFKPRNDWNIIALNCKKRDNNFIETRIARIIKEYTGINVFSELSYRGREFVQARNIFMAIMAVNSSYTKIYIASLVGKDHAVCSYAQIYCRNMCETDKIFRELYNTIEKKVKSLN